jgi:hypothetical protein
MKAITTKLGTIRTGDKVSISGVIKAEWTRTVIEVNPRYIKVVGGIKFDIDTLVSRECSAHRITEVLDA